MLQDITIGQYFPQNSVVHRLDPRMKLILTILFIVILFLVNSLPIFIVPILFTLAGYLLAKIPLKMIFKSMKPIIPIIIFTGILNMFFVKGDIPLFAFGKLELYAEGIITAICMALRILCLIAGSSLLTYTTSPIELTDGIEQLMAPLKKIKFPAHELAMMMSIALRFIPTLIEETNKIISAQKARGTDMETGGLMKKIRSLMPILIPLFVSAFRRAEELALSMECRCYNGGIGRTRMNKLHYGARDFVALVITLLTLGVIIALKYIL
ncbi:MAG: energy-coupling factor transporter transmembrane protein EcfT [Oscillospiraceae bacterium]|nr:energy-coupling factor transporter transmembrane protein EcfT [Oscillospiraceae bacterium]